MVRIWELVFIVEIMRCVEFGIAVKDQHGCQADRYTCPA